MGTYNHFIIYPANLPNERYNILMTTLIDILFAVIISGGILMIIDKYGR
jgi:hypothetical protein